MHRILWTSLLCLGALTGCASQIEVGTEPPNANVYLQGGIEGSEEATGEEIFIGTTPVSFAPDQPEGVYDLVVELEGYRREARRIRLPLSDDVEAWIQLQEAEPEDAE